MNDAKSASKIICFCNRVSEQTILSAIQSKGLKTLSEVYDACGAGVGPCGGSCRENIKPLLGEAQNLATAQAKPLPLELVKALSLFNRRYYWETHEVLEDMWREETGPDRLFLQALIQAAAALYHVLNGNPTGVLKLSETALQKLAQFPEKHLTIDTHELRDSLRHYQAEAKEILGKTWPGFDYARLPHLVHGTSMEIPGRSQG